MTNELFTKIRVDFLFAHPFLSVLALSLPHHFVQNGKYPITTDGKNISLDAAQLTAMPDEEVKYLYAHVLLHVALKHPSRQKMRDTAIWNTACDIVVNIVLSKFKNIGKAPIGEEPMERFEKMIAEEVYERIKSDSENEGEQKDIEESEYSSQQDEENGETLDALLVQALSMARADAAISEGFLLEIGEIIKPDIRFDDVLKEYLCVSLFEKRESFERPNRRYIHQGIYMPGFLRPSEFLNLYIAVDSSMSVGEEEYRRFLGAASTVTQSFSEYKIVIVPFDSKINKNLIVRLSGQEPFSDELFRIPKTDGGTDIECVYEFVEQDEELSHGATLLVLTDGYFVPYRSPPIETVFLVSERKNISRFEEYGKTVWLGI